MSTRTSTNLQANPQIISKENLCFETKNLLEDTYFIKAFNSIHPKKASTEFKSFDYKAKFETVCRAYLNLRKEFDNFFLEIEKLERGYAKQIEEIENEKAEISKRLRENISSIQKKYDDLMTRFEKQNKENFQLNQEVLNHIESIHTLKKRQSTLCNELNEAREYSMKIEKTHKDILPLQELNQNYHAEITLLKEKNRQLEIKLIAEKEERIKKQNEYEKLLERNCLYEKLNSNPNEINKDMATLFNSNNTIGDELCSNIFETETDQIEKPHGILRIIYRI